MAENAVAFELVSPERLLLSEDVEMVVIPGADGDFGVLSGHSPVLSNVRPGVIHVFAGGSVQQRIFVAGGFAEVTGERCTVLADEALPVDDIDTAAVEADLQLLAEDLTDTTDDAERSQIEDKMAVGRAKLTAASLPLYQ